MKNFSFAFILVIQRKPFKSLILSILQENKYNSSGAHSLSNLFRVIKMIRKLAIKRYLPFCFPGDFMYDILYIYSFQHSCEKLVCAYSIQRETEAG